MNKNAQKKMLSNLEISSFCGQMAMILKSGISTLEGVTIMLEDTVTSDEGAILSAILADLQESGELTHALESTGLFPSYLLQMVRIGEETGTLDEVMSALSDHYDREDSIAQTIRSAVTYPTIMAGIMVIVILVLLIKVMPIFNQVFIQLGSEMTGFSHALMQMGSVINNYAITFIALLVAVVALLLYATRTAQGRKTSRAIGVHIKPIRHIFENMAACRFASGMALTLSSGLNPERSMELVCALGDDPLFQKKLDRCQQWMAEGKDLSEALHLSGIFTGVYAHIASIGAKTGSMDDVMRQIAEMYQDDLDARISNTLSIIEPTLVITLSLIVGVILMSVMLPLMGIMSSI